MHSSVNKGFSSFSTFCFTVKKHSHFNLHILFLYKNIFVFWLNKFLSLIINFNLINLIYQSIINLFLEPPCT